MNFLRYLYYKSICVMYRYSTLIKGKQFDALCKHYGMVNPKVNIKEPIGVDRIIKNNKRFRNNVLSLLIEERKSIMNDINKEKLVTDYVYIGQSGTISNQKPNYWIKYDNYIRNHNKKQIKSIDNAINSLENSIRKENVEMLLYFEKHYHLE